MRAYRMTQWEHHPELVDVPEPEPGPGQVVIKVGGSGACHSDLHVIDWPAGQLPWELPYTVGHETAGWVHAVGAGVDGFALGETVIVYGPWGEGRCRACRLGRENYCESAAMLGAAGGGLGRDGGMAEYMLVPHARWLVSLGDLDPVEAAPLADAALTPYHAIKRSLHLLRPGSSVVAIGVGGLGHSAVELLKVLSPAQVIAVDLSEEKLGLAREVGADATVRVGQEDTAEAIRDLTHGRGAEVVLDFVGVDQTLELGTQTVRAEGHLTLVGIGGGTFPFGFFSQPYECSVATTYWGSLPELMEVVALARAGHLRIRSERFPLDRVAEAYQLMREGRIQGRAVIKP
jgi:propanol-preferring alcohol dehydrogenase